MKHKVKYEYFFIRVPLIYAVEFRTRSAKSNRYTENLVKYWYTLGFGGISFHLFIIGGRIGQDPSRICDEETPDANPDTWTNT